LDHETADLVQKCFLDRCSAARSALPRQSVSQWSVMTVPLMRIRGDQIQISHRAESVCSRAIDPERRSLPLSCRGVRAHGDKRGGGWQHGLRPVGAPTLAAGKMVAADKTFGHFIAPPSTSPLSFRSYTRTLKCVHIRKSKTQVMSDTA